MSAKNTEGAETPSKEMTKHVGADVPADLKREVRIQAAREDREMAPLVRDALREYLDD